MNAVILDHNIDTSFITQLEQRNDHYKFMRIDADLTESLKDESGADLTEATTTLSEVFKKALNNDKLTVKVENLKNADVASVLTLSEQGRRMQDMMKMYFTSSLLAFNVSVWSAANMLGSIPPMPPAAYIFIISCIRLPCSESVSSFTTLQCFLTSRFQLHPLIHLRLFLP